MWNLVEETMVTIDKIRRPSLTKPLEESNGEPSVKPSEVCVLVPNNHDVKIKRSRRMRSNDIKRSKVFSCLITSLIICVLILGLCLFAWFLLREQQTNEAASIADNNLIGNENGGYGPWKVATSCSVTCGEGTRTMKRECLQRNRNCTGSHTQNVFCVDQPICVVNGSWGSWSNWVACTKTCGAGIMSRFRYRDSPRPSGAGAMSCGSSASQYSTCSNQNCDTIAQINISSVGTIESDGSSGFDEYLGDKQTAGFFLDVDKSTDIFNSIIERTDQNPKESIPERIEASTPVSPPSIYHKIISTTPSSLHSVSLSPLSSSSLLADISSKKVGHEFGSRFDITSTKSEVSQNFDIISTKRRPPSSPDQGIASTKPEISTEASIISAITSVDILSTETFSLNTVNPSYTSKSTTSTLSLPDISPVEDPINLSRHGASSQHTPSTISPSSMIQSTITDISISPIEITGSVQSSGEYINKAHTDCHWTEFSEWRVELCSRFCGGGVGEERRTRYSVGHSDCRVRETQSRTVACSTRSCNRVFCDFDTQPLCGYVNDNTTGLLWKQSGGSTPTTHTGPGADHTSGLEGKYIYMEASGTPSGGMFRISTPVFESYGESCLSFWYHMKGFYMGTINVYVEHSSRPMFSMDHKIWSTFGHRGSLWNFAYMNIPNKNFRVVFEGVRGSDVNSDAAIDDVLIEEGACSIPSKSVTCDFEEAHLCGYVQSSDDDFDWSWETIATPTDKTGCDTDHTYGNGTGHYLYIEASQTQPRSRAAIASPVTKLNGGENRCLTWWYHMNGDDIADLEITASIHKTHIIIAQWQRTGAQGNFWIKGSLQISCSAKSSVEFKFSATKGEGQSKGDICLDDISLVDGAC
ncbi:unnamed protein product [Owenia fusiformis]|uniref:MAM domain-containing protein n=1 Tax=Owenia fusiformis TaxID=6347 RepID=A0A8S4Q785_OWEFU|nr:unnamed protein product [Owenia fusiformis]